MSTLYENIRFYCDKAGISGAKLCADSGISKSTLTSLKNGRTKKISTDNLYKMANRLGVSVDDLLGSETKEKSPTPEGVELLDEPNKKALIEYVLKKNFTDGQAKAVLSFIKQYEEGGD
ncbi:MAG: helix-turn-helix transcriptional regulator [Bacteroidaceae bacterium]|nr:helix-turn-helix transcriptional regulator [Bacteroidaceae bacterium]MBR4930406.1 helix-turn-helix transcriptional regulator [Bacteroidaceae bacterium]